MNVSKWLMPALAITVLVTSLVGFLCLQNEINQLKSSSPSQTSTPNLTPSPTPTPAPSPIRQPSSSSESKLPYAYVVYEWHLKPEYIGNITWLNQTLKETRGILYDSGKTWSENYISYFSNFEALPQQIADSESMGPISKWTFIRQLYVNASFNEATGFTKAICQYDEYHGVPFHYDVESILPILADGRGWTKTFV